MICCSTPVMLRIHTFFLPFRTLFLFPLHNFDFEERENRRPYVLSNSLYGSIGNSSGLPILEWAGIRAINPNLSCNYGCLLGKKHTQSNLLYLGFWSFLGLSHNTWRLQANQQFIRTYSDIIAELLLEKIQGQKILKKIYTIQIETKICVLKWKIKSSINLTVHPNLEIVLH